MMRFFYLYVVSCVILTKEESIMLERDSSFRVAAFRMTETILKFVSL